MIHKLEKYASADLTEIRAFQFFFPFLLWECFKNKHIDHKALPNQLIDKYFLIAYYVPSTIQGGGDTLINETKEAQELTELTFGRW